MSTRTKYILAALVLLAIILVVRNRAMWVRLIKAKWGKRVSFVNDYQDSFWDTLSRKELITAYMFGLPTWAEDSPTAGNSGTF
jgi:hypothetical protein